MKRHGITAILCGALLVGLPAAAADENPPPPTDPDVDLLEEGTLLISWDPVAQTVEYSMYRNGAVLATVAESDSIDWNPEEAAVYEITSVSTSAESDPSDRVMVVEAGADAIVIESFLPSTFSYDLTNTDTFFGTWPPTCTLVGVSVVPYPPFVGAHVNQGCLGAWLDP